MTPRSSDQVDLSIRQFVSAWQTMSSAAPSYQCHSGAGVECVFSGVQVAFFNAAVVTARDVSEAALQEAAVSAREWAADRGVGWILVVTNEALREGVDAARALDGCGFSPLMPLTGMVAREVGPVSRVPEGLELRLVDDDASGEAVLDVNAAAYGMPLEAGKGVWGRRAFWKDHVGVLGVAEGQPVSSTAVMMVEGYRYVALVATAPGRQRRGYADAAMRRSLEVAGERFGKRPTFLHATEAGRPVYKRMGYEAVSTHVAFMEKRFLEGH